MSRTTSAQVSQERRKEGAQGRAAWQREREGRVKKGVRGVDEGYVEDVGAEFAQDPGDVYLSVVEEVREVGAEQTIANLPELLPPALADLDKFNPWTN